MYVCVSFRWNNYLSSYMMCVVFMIKRYNLYYYFIYFRSGWVSFMVLIFLIYHFIPVIILCFMDIKSKLRRKMAQNRWKTYLHMHTWGMCWWFFFWFFCYCFWSFSIGLGRHIKKKLKKNERVWVRYHLI